MGWLAWKMPTAKLYGFVRTQHECHSEVAVKLLGTKGQAVEGRIEGENPWRYSKKRLGGHAQEQVDFFAALRSGETINNGEYMARSTMVALMGQVAAYTGKKVGWDEVNKSDFRYPPTDRPVAWNTVPPVLPDLEGIYPVPMPGKTKIV